MEFLKNKDVVIKISAVAIIGAVFSAVSFAFGHFEIMTAALLMASVYISLELFFAYKRYKNTEKLSIAIDKILHGSDEFNFEEFDEGEFAVLSSEVYKMTMRLRQQKTALQNDKEYLSNSIADISHQVKTPLTSLNLIVSMLSKEDVTPERKHELVHEMRELLVRIDWLITTLLKMSKLDAGTARFRTEEISVLKLIKAATEPLMIPIELRGQELKLEVPDKVYFSGDFSWTSEAVANIVKNCMEHTANGGELSVSASENALFTEIIIKDNGSGIAKEDLPHIFERFYKGKNSDEKSYGIGLALARMIIVSQNGTVKAENRRQGAKFTIRFYKQTV